VTPNPASFENAIDETDDYAGVIRRLGREGKCVREIYQALVREIESSARFRGLASQDSLV
jgi:hypothetical protein